MNYDSQSLSVSTYKFIAIQITFILHRYLQEYNYSLWYKICLDIENLTCLWLFIILKQFIFNIINKNQQLTFVLHFLSFCSFCRYLKLYSILLFYYYLLYKCLQLIILYTFFRVTEKIFYEYFAKKLLYQKTLIYIVLLQKQIITLVQI